VRYEGFHAGVDIGAQSGTGVAYLEILEVEGGRGGFCCLLFMGLRLERLLYSYSEL